MKSLLNFFLEVKIPKIVCKRPISRIKFLMVSTGVCCNDFEHKKTTNKQPVITELTRFDWLDVDFF